MVFNVAMTPVEYAKVRAEVAATKQVYAHTESGELAGTLSTPQVNMSYAYDGSAQLSIDVFARHGLAKFASDDEIERRIEALLKSVTD